MSTEGCRPRVHLVINDAAWRSQVGAWIGQTGEQVLCHPRLESFLTQERFSARGCLIVALRYGEVHRVRSVRQMPSSIPVIVLSETGDIDTAVGVMKEGAFDCLELPFSEASFTPVIKAALEEDARLSHVHQSRVDLHARHASLTPRECEIMEMLAVGALNKVIASRLGLSRRTVETHRTSVMTKMRADSVAQLVGMSLTLRSTERIAHGFLPAA